MRADRKMKQKDRTKKELNKAKEKALPFKGQIIGSIITGIIATIYLRLNRFIPAVSETNINPNLLITLAIFLLAFGLSMALMTIDKWKDKFKGINRNIWLLIISVVAGLMVAYPRFEEMPFWSWMVYASLAIGICFAFISLFERIGFKKVEKNILLLVKKLACGVLFPSMFLIIALMGKIDKTGAFLLAAKESLMGNVADKSAGYFIGKGFYTITESIYNLGKWEYSGIFMAAIFIFLIYFALRSFFKDKYDDSFPQGDKDETKEKTED